MNDKIMTKNSDGDFTMTSIRLSQLIFQAAGMLLLGVSFAAIGAYAGNEWVTCMLAAFGMIIGAILGHWVGSPRN